jgi:hypothetical protein
MGGGHVDSASPTAGGWPANQAGADDPEVARLLAVLANTGPADLTVTQLVAASGRQKTWFYDRLADLQQAGQVERAGQGRSRLTHVPKPGG